MAKKKPSYMQRRSESELIDVAADTLKRALDSDDVGWVMKQALRMETSLEYELRGGWKCGEESDFGRFYGDRLAKLSESKRKRVLREVWETCITHPDHGSPKLARIMVSAAMKVLDGWKYDTSR